MSIKRSSHNACSGLVTRLLQKNQGQDHKEYKISGTANRLSISCLYFSSPKG